MKGESGEAFSSSTDMKSGANNLTVLDILFVYKMKEFIYSFFIIICSYTLSMILKEIFCLTYPSIGEDVNYISGSTISTSIIFECVVVALAASASIYYVAITDDDNNAPISLFVDAGGVEHNGMSPDAPTRHIRNDTLHPNEIMLVRLWSTVMFMLLAYTPYAPESVISPPIFILSLLTSISGFFIQRSSVLVSSFHIFSTLSWLGLFDLSIRSQSWFGWASYPHQCMLASMFLTACVLRAKLLSNNRIHLSHYSSATYQYVGIPILLLIYWSLEIPFCEVVHKHFQLQLAVCEFSQNSFFNNGLSSSENNNFRVFAAFVLQFCHVFFGFLCSIVTASPLSPLVGEIITEDVSAKTTNQADALPVADTSLGRDAPTAVCVTEEARQQKTASRSANRLERGRAGRVPGSQSRTSSDSVSSTDTDSSDCSSASSLSSSSLLLHAKKSGHVRVGGSHLKKQSPTAVKVSSPLSIYSEFDDESTSNEDAVPSGGDFLPTLSLLTSSPFWFSSAPPSVTSSTVKDESEASASVLPSTSHLLQSLPSLSPVSFIGLWTACTTENKALINNVQQPLRLPVEQKPVICSDINLSDSTLQEISEEEACDIVQRGLLHVKSLRAN